MILYTLSDKGYLDIGNLDNRKGISCYVNSTNRCSCACIFCLRQTKEMMENNSLWLDKEPSVSEIISEFDKYDLNDFKEVVFCGFGEPLIRHDDLMEVARYLKKRRSDLVIRVNTNGLSSLYHNRDITKDFKGLLDIVSISLNTSNPEEYLKLTRSMFGLKSHEALLDFASKSKEVVDKVVLSVVDTTISEEDINNCKAIALQLGVDLRIRPFE